MRSAPRCVASHTRRTEKRCVANTRSVGLRHPPFSNGVTKTLVQSSVSLMIGNANGPRQKSVLQVHFESTTKRSAKRPFGEKGEEKIP